MANLTGNMQKEVVLTAEGDLTVERAIELKRMLLNALRDAASVAILFKENSRLDVSFLQLLCAAKRSALASGKDLKLVQNIPDNLLAEIRTAGYSHHPIWDIQSNIARVGSQGGNNE